MRINRSFSFLVFLGMSGLLFTWLLHGQEKNEELIPFVSNETNRRGYNLWGYTNPKGQVVIEPRFFHASETWSDGFAWVDVEECTNFNTCLECDGLGYAGDFIDKSGKRLVNKHIHALVGEPWGIGWEPRFEQGLAFVKFPDGTIFCITTNGIPLDVHKEHGPFVDYCYGVLRYAFNHQGVAVFRVKSGGYGLLSTNGTVVVAPTNTRSKISQLLNELTVDTANESKD
ncbi:MAG: WG repeat-containing protein [Kiritimatiellia bacterium]|jgi:hypothetical protein